VARARRASLRRDNNVSDPAPSIRLRAIEKRYGGVQALKGVDLDVFPGEVHCLLGENGAGKSTLIRILAGATAPTGGTIDAGERTFSALDPATSRDLGIGVVYQEIDLVPLMTVAENITLGEEPVGGAGLLDRAAQLAIAHEALSHFDRRIDLHARVADLSPPDRQLVQIAKTIARHQRVLVLDEPTASLSANEVEHLLDVVKAFRARGMAIIYISHRMDEIRRIGDRVTILRDGERIHSGPLDDIDDAAMIGLIVGRPVETLFSRTPHAPGEVALSVRDLSLAGEFSGVSFAVRYGEVVGIAGLVGAGRSALVETLFGLHRPDGGTVAIDGRPYFPRGSSEAIVRGLGLVPEERRSAGLILDQSIATNVSLPNLDRLSVAGFFARGRARKAAQELVGRLAIKAPTVDALVATLSGGNQQKAVLAKWLGAETRILLLDEPTRGVDVGAKTEIWRLVDRLAAEGFAILFVSSELPEIMGLSDRVLVMCEGRLTADLVTARTDPREIIGRAMPRRDAGRIAA
jgi:ABC-type sugar transport system ATPase subunit